MLNGGGSADSPTTPHISSSHRHSPRAKILTRYNSYSLYLEYTNSHGIMNDNNDGQREQDGRDLPIFPILNLPAEILQGCLEYLSPWEIRTISKICPELAQFVNGNKPLFREIYLSEFVSCFILGGNGGEG